jgi:hypothetical protein
MSRTRHSGKSAGYESWSRRPETKKALGHGSYPKRVNARMERQRNKCEARRGES